MSVSIAVPDQKLRALNEPARKELERAVDRYTNDLLAEAGRLEASANTAKGAPEITTSMVRDADLLLRHGYARGKQHWVLRVLKVVATTSGIITGVMADATYLKDLSHIVYFVVAVAVTVATTVATLLKE